MDLFPPNVQLLGAPPFSLDAARRRQTANGNSGDTSATASAPPSPATRISRRHPHLELIAGSAIPEPTPSQVTDARERFLRRLNRERGGELASTATSAERPLQAGPTPLRLTPRPLPWRGDGPGCA